MKLLSVAIPCYNSENYMRHCIETLLPGGDEVEILIVDDGSAKDRTGEIADEYERKYPGICRAIHQENGGHGEAVNAGLRNASGIYFKVVDSDDWVNEEAYMEVLDTAEKGDELSESPSRAPADHLERGKAFYAGTVHPHALGHLPHGAAQGVRT